MPYMGIDPPAMREMIADYYNSLSRLDTLVGRLLEALDQSGKAENTLVVYLGDHGADMLRGKRTCFEGGVRIPLLLRWPGHVQAQVRDELVSSIDLMPTLLAAAGADPVPDLPGRAWQPLFRKGPVRWRTHLFTEYHMHSAKNFFPQRAVRGSRFKLIENLLPGEAHPDYEATFTKLAGEARLSDPDARLNPHAVVMAAPPEVRAAYERMRKPPRFELYDLENDPHEFRNLAPAPEHQATLRDLQQQLAAWRVRTNDPLRDRSKLLRLAAEVRSVKSRKAARARSWSYPGYFADGASVPVP
jgi:N-sulfoglucosamine sulfohydrolase